MYWNADILTSGDKSTVTAPFSTNDYNATILLRCKTGSDADFESCPAGTLFCPTIKQNKLPRRYI